MCTIFYISTSHTYPRNPSNSTWLQVYRAEKQQPILYTFESPAMPHEKKAENRAAHNKSESPRPRRGARRRIFVHCSIYSDFSRAKRELDRKKKEVAKWFFPIYAPRSCIHVVCERELCVYIDIQRRIEKSAPHTIERCFPAAAATRKGCAAARCDAVYIISRPTRHLFRSREMHFIKSREGMMYELFVREMMQAVQCLFWSCSGIRSIPLRLWLACIGLIVDMVLWFWVFTNVIVVYFKKGFFFQLYYFLTLINFNNLHVGEWNTSLAGKMTHCEKYYFW